MIDHQLCELIGGPFAHNHRRLSPGAKRLYLELRPKKRKGERVPTAIYERVTDSGPLRYLETLGLGDSACDETKPNTCGTCASMRSDVRVSQR